ncbi:DEAD/DEAH box RNA helicase [Penicillium pulvis]|uniref:DEAD/DEAH box RNA helicase n=1 Tax=Penicillium pulvis TaxID=1562058 RepID=UPI0025488F0A|nr:DEAD/DEAH box RNA helicase [Penicillium pulvis]KAJ5797990.1 DEAD/DEAH box RNA helicase [Penicillium pulvis]
MDFTEAYVENNPEEVTVIETPAGKPSPLNYMEYSAADAHEWASMAASNTAPATPEADPAFTYVALAPTDANPADQNALEHGWGERTAFNYDEDGAKESHDWASNAARYEWKGEYDESAIGPRNEDLEKMLFDSDLIPRAGNRVSELTDSLAVVCDSQTPIAAVKEWDDAGLHPIMRENVRLCLYDKPTAIQSFALPAVSSGKDLIGIAHTGSGKTGAFLIPILSDLMGKAKKLAAARPNLAEEFIPSVHGVTAEPLVLIVCPTRELATQIFDETRRLCYRSMLRPCVAYGGAPVRLQREELMKGCDILIGSPGRIIDFMGQPNVLSLRRVRYTVIDEADELLHFDWEEDFKKIMSGGDMNEDEDHRYMMFSATFDKECRRLARTYMMKDYIRVRVGRPGSSHLMVSQRVFEVPDSGKKTRLYETIMSHMPTRTLVFVNSKTQVDFVDDYLYNQGLPCTSIHSDRTQREREDAIRAFRTAECPILVATGISARGLDIVNVMHVINYDLPKAHHGGITEYIHRIGRTARIGNEGIATSFYNDRDEDIAPALVKILLETKQDIPECLQQFRPEEDAVTFDDDTDQEEDGDDKKNGDGDKAAFSGDESKTVDSDDNRQSRWTREDTKKEEVQPEW